MKECIREHGLWPTVGAIVAICIFLSVLGLAWRLPEILVALK